MNTLSFVMYLISTAFTPGPNNIAGMSNASQHGLRNGFIFNLGICTGQIGIPLTCALFCNAFAEIMAGIELPMKIVGAAYILWLAWSLYRSSGSCGQVETVPKYSSGLLVCLLNPKYYLYSLVSIETYVAPFYGDSTAMMCLFALLIGVVGFSATTSWSIFGSVFRRLFTEHAKAVNTVLALSLVYCAVSMFL